MLLKKLKLEVGKRLISGHLQGLLILGHTLILDLKNPWKTPGIPLKDPLKTLQRPLEENIQKNKWIVDSIGDSKS